MTFSFASSALSPPPGATSSITSLSGSEEVGGLSHVDSLDDFFFSWGFADRQRQQSQQQQSNNNPVTVAVVNENNKQEEGIGAKVASTLARGRIKVAPAFTKTIITGTAPPLKEYSSSSNCSRSWGTTSRRSSNHPGGGGSFRRSGTSFDEFGFPFFSSLSLANDTPTIEEEEKKEEEEKVVLGHPRQYSSDPIVNKKQVKEKEDDDDQLGELKEYQRLIQFTHSKSEESSVSALTKGTVFGCASTAGMSSAYYNRTTTAMATNKTPNNKNKSGSRKRPSSVQRALSKLTACGHSAKEDSLDLEYLVMSLRQSLTAQEATTSLRAMVKILKRGGGGGTPTSTTTKTTKKGGNSSSLSTRQIQEGLVERGADHCVISTLWNFPSNIPVQYFGIIALGELVAHSNLTNQKSIVMKGGIEVVLTAMKTHVAEEPIQEEACRTLKNLMKYYDQAKQNVARHRGITRILSGMMTHPEYAGVQRQACYALTSLSCLKSISDEMVGKQGHAVLIKTMQHHNDDCYVLAEAWRTLTNIVIHSMNTTLDEEIAQHGLDLVCQSLRNFEDCTLVPIQARGLTLLTHLCYRSPANLERLTLTNNLEIIHRILRVRRDDEKVQAAGEKLVQQISQAGYSLPQQQQQQQQQQFQHQHQYQYQQQQQQHRGTSSLSIGGPPPKNAVLGQIQNERGLDVIVDSTMY